MRSSARSILPLAGWPLAAGLVLLGACRPADDGAVTARAVPQYTIEEFLGTTGLAGASFSPDGGTILVSSDRTGVYNAFAVPVAGGDPVQLTQSTTDAVLVQSYFPADERFLYLSDRGGNELTHLYVRAPDGTVTDLTPGEKLKANFLGWAEDNGSFFISTNGRDPKYFDIHEVASDGYRRTLLYRDTTGYDFADISRDRRYLAFDKSRTTTDSDIYLYDRQTGTMRNLTPHEGEVLNQAQTFDHNGTGLYCITDEGSEFQYLVRQDLATGRREVIEKPGWDVWNARLSKHGKYMVVGINNDARTEIRIYEAATRTRVALPDLPPGDVTSVAISDREDRVALYIDGNRTPKDLFVWDLGRRDARQLTRTLNPKIDPDALVDAQVVRFRSYDGAEIPGLLYRPHQVDRRARAPAIVWVHGGPGGQSRVGYSGLIQYLVNHGYVVYAINNRGSSGYGKTFYKMDDRRHGDADLGDCVASKGFLAKTGFVDPARIGIAGGSYGGYMVLAALAFRPEEFAVGVDIFGVANWVRTLKEIPPWWESFRQALYKEIGDPAVDEEYLHKISPLFHSARIARPLIVLQGANDPRVHKVESDEMVQQARARGVPVEYVVFDDEGHGFRKKENQLRGYKAILDFLDTHLKPVPQAAS